MKKLLSVYLVIVMLFTLIPLGSLTASAETLSGTTGDCTWTLVDGVLTISGNGEMEDYDVEVFDLFVESNSPWYNNNDIKKVIVSQGIATIGDGAFAQCKQLVTVEIAPTVVSIGMCAFANTAIKDICIPKSIKEIDYGAFLLVDTTHEWINLLDNVFFEGNELNRKDLFINKSDGLNNSIINANWHYNTCSVHTYINSCDTTCEKCDTTRETKHTYDDQYDGECNVCKDTRKVPQKDNEPEKKDENSSKSSKNSNGDKTSSKQNNTANEIIFNEDVEKREELKNDSKQAETKSYNKENFYIMIISAFTIALLLCGSVAIFYFIKKRKKSKNHNH